MEVDLVMRWTEDRKGESDPGGGHSIECHQLLRRHIWGPSCKPQVGSLADRTVAPKMSRTCRHVRLLEMEAATS